MATDENLAADRRYASRKFILAAVIILIGSVAWLLSNALEPLPDITTDQWILLCKWVLGLYMAGNVGDSAVDRLFANTFLTKATAK